MFIKSFYIIIFIDLLFYLKSIKNIKKRGIILYCKPFSKIHNPKFIYLHIYLFEYNYIKKIMNLNKSHITKCNEYK